MKRFLSIVLLLALLSGCAATAAEPNGAPGEEPPAAEPAATKVETVDELIAAVAPGAVIELGEGTFSLSASASYGGETGSDYCRWVDAYDGYELEIHDVYDLTLRGAGADKTTISALPRYANVLTFRNSVLLRVEDLTAGHTEAPGWCSGGVLHFVGCRDTDVARCALFGCGTIGVWAEECVALCVKQAQIYECSYNAVSVSGCRDVTVTDCEVHSCGVKDSGSAISLFESRDSEGFTVSATSIHDNSALSLLQAEGSRNVWFLTNDVLDNRFEDVVFSLSQSMVTADGCGFGNNRFLRWTRELRPVNAAGEPLSDEMLDAMERREIDPSEITAATPAPAVEVAPGGEVRVTNIDELLAAIGPERTIVLAPGVYDLSAAADYGGFGGEYYSWRESYDGPELVIDGAKGLTICAESDAPAATVITAVPRYANVLAFQSCEDLTIKGLTVGHTQAPGECSGGVINLQGCSGTSIRDCRLYGCGISGVNASDGAALEVRGCEIYDCSWCAAYVSGYDGVTFSDCDIHDVPCPALYVDACADALWNGAALDNGMYDVIDDALVPFTWPEPEPEPGALTPFREGSAELAFALEVQRVFAQGDWAALSKIAQFPLQVIAPEGSYLFPDAESLENGRLDELLYGEFRRQVACAPLTGYGTGVYGSTFADGAVAFAHVQTTEGEALRITAVSTLYSLD